MRKKVKNQKDWGKVIPELEGESDKLQAYDETIISHIGNFHNLEILDYGAGPAIMAKHCAELGANIKIYEVSQEMLEISKEKLGEVAVYDSVSNIPDNFFDVIFCNLVVCIIGEKDVLEIFKVVREKINPNGKIYIGFCNPKIFAVEESRLDYRFPTGEHYNCNHDYKKIKKEGDYEIIEKHRPIEWYEDIIKKSGLKISNILYTPEYELKNEKIKDFIIFELVK